jgi:site-specific recombinase XerC
MTQKLTQELTAAANLAGIDYQAERETFLANAGRSGSKHTRRSYAADLGRMEAYAERAHVSPLELTPMRADDFIYSMKGEAAAATVRRIVAACSSFFTWLERRHEGIRNPFRGTKARPAKKAEKALAIPNAAEVKKILAALPAYEAAAVSVMAFRGLRIGGLPGMEINNPEVYKPFVTHLKDLRRPPAAAKPVSHTEYHLNSEDDDDSTENDFDDGDPNELGIKRK